MTEAQWLTIYRQTVRDLYRYVSFRTGGEHDLTEDIVQETYTRALNHWFKKSIPNSPLAWLKRVAHNLLISYFRGSHCDKPENLDLKANTDFSEFSLDGPTGHEVFLALSFLKKKQAKILEAFHFDGKSMKEIGTHLGISERAVEGRLRRARQALKIRLIKVSKQGGK